MRNFPTIAHFPPFASGGRDANGECSEMSSDSSAKEGSLTSELSAIDDSMDAPRDGLPDIDGLTTCSDSTSRSCSS